MIKKSSGSTLVREIVVGVNNQGIAMKGAFECTELRVGLVPIRVEPRK